MRPVLVALTTNLLLLYIGKPYHFKYDREYYERYEGSPMTECKLIGKRIVSIVPEREMVLEYFMLEDVDETSKLTTYGAKIRKVEEGKEETESVMGITSSKEIITSLVNLLLENVVTPISMVEIVDDFVTEKLCS